MDQPPPTPKQPHSSRDRVLQTAGRLFMERGYRAVRLRDIADELGVKIASLYYYAPGGKEELYVAVVLDSLAQHREGLTQALDSSSEGIESKLLAIVRWFYGQSRMNVGGLLDDLEELGDEARARVQGAFFVSIMKPLCDALDAEYDEGKIRHVDVRLFSGAFMSILDTVRTVQAIDISDRTAEDMMREMIDILVHGLSESHQQIDRPASSSS